MNFIHGTWLRLAEEYLITYLNDYVVASVYALPPRASSKASQRHWVHEVKHDGYRLIARKADGVVRLYTKQGYDWTRKYPLIVEALYRLRAKSVVLDGEAMCFTDGMHDFEKLWSNCFDETVTLCAFDLLELNGEDFRDKPWLERKKRLAKLLVKPRHGLEYVEHLEGDGQRIFEHACRLGLEGIVSKRLDLRYRAGLSKAWVKTKNKSQPALMRVKVAFEEESRHAGNRLRER